MQIVKTQDGLELKPDNDWEKEALKHIAGKILTANFSNLWEQSGKLKLEFKTHPWDEK